MSKYILGMEYELKKGITDNRHGQFGKNGVLFYINRLIGKGWKIDCSRLVWWILKKPWDWD